MFRLMDVTVSHSAWRSSRAWLTELPIFSSNRKIFTTKQNSLYNNNSQPFSVNESYSNINMLTRIAYSHLWRIQFPQLISPSYLELVMCPWTRLVRLDRQQHQLLSKANYFRPYCEVLLTYIKEPVDARKTGAPILRAFSSRVLEFGKPHPEWPRYHCVFCLHIHSA